MTVPAGSKRRTWQEPRPSFRWQALLILLPVVVLSILGLLAVRRDFALTKQEAQARATEIARLIAERLGQPLARELSSYELPGNLWRGQGIIGARGFWPGTKPLPAEDRMRYEQQLAQWQAEHPGWRPEDLFPIEANWTDGIELLRARGTVSGSAQ